MIPPNEADHTASTRKQPPKRTGFYNVQGFINEVPLSRERRSRPFESVHFPAPLAGCSGLLARINRLLLLPLATQLTQRR